ncbi:MAG: hypothetical protein H6Q73_192 [Firmicutes bacterium]|nr:hypothetical protein [Bacillota bacterium]
MKWGGKKPLPLTRDELNKIHKAMFDVQSSGQWLEKWKDIRDYINPYIGFFDEDMPNNGERRDDLMINTLPLQANNIQASGMQDGITSPSRPWYRLAIVDPTLQDNDEVKRWCDDVTNILLDLFARSNFYDSSIEFYKELGAPGTAAMLIEEDPDHGIWCRTFTIGEYAVGTDHRNRVNRFARNVQMNVAEMVSAFGLDNCPNTVQVLWKNKSVEKYQKIKHLVIPNPNYIEGKMIKWVKKYISLYWCNSDKDDDYLEIGGYDDFPFAVSRWSVKGADIYGRGPGWYALGDAKALQAMEEDIHTGIKKQVEPPTIAPVDILSAGGVNTLPNGVTYYSRDVGANPVQSLYQVNLAIQEVEAKKQSIEAEINKHFYVDLFSMLENEMADRSQITAREIIERVQEKMSRIGPVFNRLQHEFLQPVIDRVFNIAMRNNLLPPPPDVLQGVNLKIEYVSVMAQAQKMQGITALQQFTEYAGELSQLSQGSVLDKIDFDKLVDKSADMLGISPSIIKSDEQVAKTRQQRAQQEQAAQAMAAVQQTANIAQTAAQTPLGNGSALDALIPGAGGYQGAGGN